MAEFYDPFDSEERPSRNLMFMMLAAVVSLRSTCRRLRVGCIITNEERTSIVSMGYNGNARNLANGCDSNQPGACGCLHAEENALIKAPYDQDLVMYTTHSPCVACAKRILNSKVREVYYSFRYRSAAGLDLLTSAGLGHWQVTDCATPSDLVLRASMGLATWESSEHHVDSEPVVDHIPAIGRRTPNVG